MLPYLLGAAAIFGAIIITTLISISLRRVVPTNEVHIVQTSKHSISYGNSTKAGNVYYEYPSWMPIFGVTKTVLPISVFKIELAGYDAYDTGRVPFEVDVVAFFRVQDSNVASQRVSNFNELREQIINIVRGAVRTVLASHDIDRIMLERSTFGDAFTKEVQEQLLQWGVVPVKNIELMDIRDGAGNLVVHNIMQKKKSLIEMESRSEVAKNMKAAQMAEIDAQREVEVQKQIATETIGLRDAERQKKVGIATQQAAQSIKEEERVTKEKEMAVTRVNLVTQAEIDKNVHITVAEAQKQANIINAEGNKQQQILGAEATLEVRKREAEGVLVNGKAKAETETALQLAPVTAQITLAKEIGSNEGYQNYLTTIKKIEAGQAVGMEQAKALEKANVKIIANTGEPTEGLTNVMDLFTPKGGTKLGGMLEALAQTEQGEKVLESVVSFKGKGK